MSESIDVSGRPAGSVSDAGRYLLNLTGPGSHVLVKEAGRGNVIIGPASLGTKADLHVAPDEAINWSAFDPFATPAGPAWPRHIDYYGNDSGFLGWSEQRGIEQFCWAPAFADARSIDAGAANIRTLEVRLDGVSGHLGMTLPEGSTLSLVGDLSRIAVAGGVPAALSLHPALGRRPGQPAYALPGLGPLQNVPSLWLYGGPLGQTISLRGIDRFPALENLALWGGFSDWEALAGANLKGLEIRFCPDLQGLPALDSWPRLDRFIAYNVDDAAGKQLKAQLKARGKVRAWSDYAAVTKLRAPAWWQSEYGRPFAGWNSRMAKAANTAYDAARNALESAGSAEAAKAAITAFARRFNGMKGIETTAREDIAEAVWQFSQLARVVRLGVTEAQAQQWLDEVREF